jgi:ATP-dependent DNA helicase RecQ
VDGRQAGFEAVTDDPAQAALRSVFGFHSFRGPQAEIIDHVIGGGDALVLMPTGGGKSLCFQIPALVRPGVAVVVSPLIALMRSQVEALRQVGVRAAYLNSTVEWREAQDIERAAANGGLDLLYVAPERLVTPRCLDLLDRAPLALFALDEAHCVSQWGHDFRPEYLQLSLLHERYPAVPRLALTATADTRTRADIVRLLRLEQAREFITSFDRPNLTYRVTIKDNPRQQLLAFLRDRHPRDAGIVYCMSRNKVDDTAAWLVKQGRDALPYHAGLPAAVRDAHQDRFIRSDEMVMVATIAFGMGIDKPDVRFVAHLDLPKSMEAYYQETGRAGRDGRPADAWMTYGMADVVLLRQLLDNSEASDDHKRAERARLEALLGYCETPGCRRQALLGYFGETLAQRCGNCDTCLDQVAQWDGSVAAQMALAAVYRTGQRFGSVHLIDVLRGEITERVVRFGHDQIKTFGVGKDRDKRSWQGIYRQLIALGLLGVDPENHRFHLTDAAYPVMKGQQTLLLRQDAQTETTRALRRPAAGGKASGKAGAAAAVAETALDDADTLLFQGLRTLRAELAKEQGVPAYVIFHDSTLEEMARERPLDHAAFARLNGVGSRKLTAYADLFIERIARG